MMMSLVIGLLLGALISWVSMVAVLNYLMGWNDRQ